MSALRITGASTARMLRTANAIPRASIIGRRHASGDNGSPIPSTEGARVPETLPKEDSPMNTPKRNSPDYDVPIDKATSYDAPR